MRANRTITLILGIAMLALGGYIALSPLWSHGRSVTGQRWLDMAFAALFILRGLMNIRRARRTQI